MARSSCGWCSLSYYIVLETVNGATPGKRLIGLKVTRSDGNAPLDWSASIVRNVLRIIDGLPLFYLAGAILIWTSEKKQRLGDRVADTIVVRIKAQGG